MTDRVAQYLAFDGSVLVVAADDDTAAAYHEALTESGMDAGDITRTRLLVDAMSRAEAADCVLLDLDLPATDGLRAIRNLVHSAPETAVIAVGGLDGPGSVEALVAGAQEYLPREELSPGTLARSLRYATERKRGQRVGQRLRAAQLSSFERARLERGLLPRPLLRTDAVDCSTYYRPGSDRAVLGGDFYDIIETSPGVIRAVIGDVMGHGPDEAALGVHLRVAWRALVLAGVPPEEMLFHLARILAAEDKDPGTFVTACTVVLDTHAEKATIRVAGHPAPMLCAFGTTRYLDVTIGPPLGVESDPVGWKANEVEVTGGSSLILYTDGLLDSYLDRAVRESLGFDEIVSAVDVLVATGEPVTAWIPRLVADAPRPSADDAAVVVLATKGD